MSFFFLILVFLGTGRLVVSLPLPVWSALCELDEILDFFFSLAIDWTILLSIATIRPKYHEIVLRYKSIYLFMRLFECKYIFLVLREYCISAIVLRNKNTEFRGVWDATITSLKEKSRYIKSTVFLVRGSCGQFG